MSATTAPGRPAPDRPARADPHRVGHRIDANATIWIAQGHGAGGHGADGPADKRIMVAYGFWVFLISDIVMFSAFFAAYAVLMDQTAGGPTGKDLFDLRNTAIETACLLASSFACGMASIGAEARRPAWYYLSMTVTFVLGLIFLTLELTEFASMVARGAGPGRSAFLSAFYTLVGCHGLHVTCGLLWLLTMMAQVWAKGFRPDILRRFICFALFWHALDIIWVGVFTVVYLFGAGGA